MADSPKIPDGPAHASTRALYEEFRERGEEQAVATKARRGRRRRRMRSAVPRTVMAVVTVLVATAIASVGTRVFTDDGAMVQPGDSPTSLRPVPPDRRLAMATAPDPVEKYPWGVRVYYAGTGDTCVVVGRIVNGRLGLVGSGRFTELSANVPGRCANIAEHHVLAAVRSYGAASGMARTVLYGVADRTVRSIAIASASGSRDVVIAPDGTFVLALEGDHALERAELRVSGASGTERRPLGPPAP